MWRTARCGAVNSFVCKMRSLCDPFLFLRAGPIVATCPLDWYDFETGVSSQVGRGRFGGPVFRCPKLAFTEYCGKRREKPSCRSPKKRPPPKPARMAQNLAGGTKRSALFTRSCGGGRRLGEEGSQRYDQPHRAGTRGMDETAGIAAPGGHLACPFQGNRHEGDAPDPGG